MTGTAHVAGAVAASAFAAAGARLRPRPDLRGARAALAGRRRRSTTSRTTPTSRRSITIVAGHRRRPARRRSTCASATRRSTPSEPDEYNAVHRDLDALHAPRLPGALRRGRRALHLPVPRRRLRLPRQGRRRPAGPPARPLLHARRATARSRSARASRVNCELERFSPRDPGEPLDGIGQYLYPSRPTIRKIDAGR